MTDRVQSLSLKDIPFNRYFSESKLLHAGLLLNVVYFGVVVGGYFIFYSYGLLSGTIFTLDFQVFYRASQVVSVLPDSLYSFQINGLPYRYFPSFALAAVWLQAVPLEAAYVLQVILMFSTNFLNLFFTYRLCQLYGLSNSTKNLEKTLLFVFIAPQQFVNMVLGQISQLFILVILASLLVMESDHQVLQRGKGAVRYLAAGCLIGLASNLKPFALLLAPSLLVVSRAPGLKLGARTQWRSPIAAVFGLLLMLTPNIAFFLKYPGTLSGFFNATVTNALDFHESTSITRLFVDFVPILNTTFFRVLLMAGIALPIFLIGYVRYMRSNGGGAFRVHFYGEMLFLVLIVYLDSWFLFLAIWYAVLGPSLLTLYETERKPNTTVWIDRTWTTANSILGFFAVGIVLHYLVFGFDPFIPPLLLVAYYCYQRALGSRLNTRSFPESKQTTT